VSQSPQSAGLNDGRVQATAQRLLTQPCSSVIPNKDKLDSDAKQQPTSEQGENQASWLANLLADCRAFNESHPA
jgi:hypothetical protein